MGASRLLTAFQRLLGRGEDDRPNGFELNQFGVRLFSRNIVLPIKHKSGLTFKDVCEHAAREVGILPINLPFFTLVVAENGHVVDLQKKLKENDCNQNYEFRFMFKGCHASWFVDKSSLDEKTHNYLFHQCRHDFLQDPPKLEFHGKDSNVWFVKAVLCELVYLAKDNEVKSTYVLDHARRFKLRSLLQRGIFANRKFKEVKSYLRQHLSKFEDLELQKIQREFLHCAEESNGYFVHEFQVNEVERNYVENRSRNVSYKLLISPQFGIKKKRENEYAEVIIENFSELSKLKITQDENDDVLVIISRTDATPQALYAQSSADAQSIVAIIDGYYKLLVNRYKVFVTDDRFRQQGHLFQVKIHGPIKRQRAESKIQEHGTMDGLFLIRKSRDHYNQYILTLLHNKSLQHYQLLEEDGEFFVKDTVKKFKNLNDLMKFYEKNKGGLVCCLVQNCPPSEEGFDALLDYQQDVPTTDRPQDLSRFDVKTIDIITIRELTEIGQGEYGRVIKAEWTRHSKENPLDVAIRKVKKDTYKEEFFAIGKQLTDLKNPNIIRCYGFVRMKNELGLVFEFASQSLDTFLREKVHSNYGSFTLKTVTQYSVQIAEGMMYLCQEMKIVHGRLCARNVLVPSDPSNIKISDVGLSQLKENGGQFFAGKESGDRHCWHAPELFLSPSSNPTHESDIWSLGETIWELFTLKKPFHRSDGSWLTRDEVIKVLMMRRKYLDTDRDSIPKGIADVIQKCLSRVPKERMGFKEVLLKLRDVLIQKDHQKDLNRLLAEDVNCIESWEEDSIEQACRPELLPKFGSDGYSTLNTTDNKDNTKVGLIADSHSGSSSSCGNLKFIPRKESLCRTNSYPCSSTHDYDEILTEKFKSLLRRQSFSYHLGTPPQQTRNEDTGAYDIISDSFHNNGAFFKKEEPVGPIFPYQRNACDEDREIVSKLTSGDSLQFSSAAQHYSPLASSVEEKAMAFLGGLSSQQKTEYSTSLPSASFSGQGKGNAVDKSDVSNDSAPVACSSLEKGTIPCLVKDSLRHFIDFYTDGGIDDHQEPYNSEQNDTQCNLVSPYHQAQTRHAQGTEPAQDISVDHSSFIKETSVSESSVSAADATGVKHHPCTKNMFPQCHDIEYDDGSDKRIDHGPSSNKESSSHEYPFRESDDNSPDNIECIHYPSSTKMPSHECPFKANSNTTDANSGYIDHPISTNESLLQECPFRENSNNNEDNTGHVNHPITSNNHLLPENPFGENINISQVNSGYVDHPKSTNESLLQECPFGKNSNNNEDNTGHVNHPITSNDHLLPENPFEENSNNNEDNTGHVNHPITSNDHLLLENPFGENISISQVNSGYIDHPKSNNENLFPKNCNSSENNTENVNHQRRTKETLLLPCPFMPSGRESNAGYVDHQNYTNEPSLYGCSFMEYCNSSENDSENNDHQSYTNEPSLPGCPFTEYCNSSENNSDNNDHQSYPKETSLPGCPFTECCNSSENNTENIEMQSYPNEPSLPGCPFMENCNSSENNTGNIDLQSYPKETSLPGFPFSEFCNSSENDTGNVDHQSYPKETSLPGCPFSEFCNSSENDTGNVDHQSYPKETSLPGCPFMEMCNSTENNTENVDHQSDTKKTLLTKCPFIEPVDLPTNESSSVTFQQDQPNAGYQLHSNPIDDQKVQKIGNKDHQTQFKSHPKHIGSETEHSLSNDFTNAGNDFSLLKLKESGAAIIPDLSDCKDIDNHVNMHEQEDAQLTCDAGRPSRPSTSISADEQRKEISKTRKISKEEFKAEVKKKYIIEKQNLRTIDKLGTGNFGVVYKGVLSEVKIGSWVNKTKDVAVKELRKAADDKSQDDFIKEAINMSKLAEIKNKNMIKFIGVCIDESDIGYKVMIITELAPLGNLKHYLEKVKERGETLMLSVLLDFCVQICNGMTELEKEDVLHRDLALRNILVVSKDLVKISDFGLSRLSEFYESKGGKWPLKWYAPESIKHLTFTSKSDVWSFGVLMWEVFSYGAKPYPEIKDYQKILHYITQGNRLPQPDNCPDDIYDIMQQCWCFDHKTRPSFYQLSSTLLPAIKIQEC